MTDPLRSPKIRPWHLNRSAFVYIRQSTPQQVAEHRESTARQYNLIERGVELGFGVGGLEALALGLEVG